MKLFQMASGFFDIIFEIFVQTKVPGTEISFSVILGAGFAVATISFVLRNLLRVSNSSGASARIGRDARKKVRNQ